LWFEKSIRDRINIIVGGIMKINPKKPTIKNICTPLIIPAIDRRFITSGFSENIGLIYSSP